MKKALILGNGKSGKSAAKMLKRMGYMTYVADDQQKNLQKLYRDRFLKSLSLIVLSPGISPNHEIIKQAKLYGIDCLCEFELGILNLECKSIMITGTNGKTTTTMLTQKLLDGGVYDNAYIGGNIGVPVTSFCLRTKPNDIAVLEASSFQLEYKKRSAAHIAAILNITPDHLSWHGTMDNYIKAKFKIFEGQTQTDFAVLNYDDKQLINTATNNIKSQIYYFSTKERVKGCFVENSIIYYSDGLSTIEIAKLDQVKLLGNHNLQNVLAGVLIAILAGEDKNHIKNQLSQFNGVSHRLEFVADIDNVGFYNDSKATNVASTIVAMNSIDADMTVILGGSDKGLSYDELFIKAPKTVKNFICIGETKQKIMDTALFYGVSNVYEVDTLKEAVDLGFSLSKNGDAVLLSPACASFDMFSSYEERGKVFMKIVREKLRHEEKQKRKKDRLREKQKNIT